MKFLNIQPFSYLKTNTSDVVKQVQETHDPVAITVNGKVQANICYTHLVCHTSRDLEALLRRRLLSM